VGRWCIEHWDQYHEAPGRQVQDIYEQKLIGGLQSDLGDLIGEFLAELSEEYEREDFNAQYALDQAESYLQKRALEVLSEEISSCLKTGDAKEAEELIRDWSKPARAISAGVDPYTDTEGTKAAFEHVAKPLFVFPGAIGRLLNDELVREGLIGIMGPMKRGKTWWLDEFAFRAHWQGNNVAFFGAGDMSERQYRVRKHVRLAGRSNRKKHCGRILVPCLDCKHNQQNECNLEQRTCRVALLKEGENETNLPEYRNAPSKYRSCTACLEGVVAGNEGKYAGSYWYKVRTEIAPLEWYEADELGQRMDGTRHRFCGGGEYKLITAPTRTLNVQGIRGHLDRWEHETGWTPTLVVCDYADILAPEPGAKEFRHQQNETWAALRSLSLERHCLVVVGTQSDAASFDQTSLKTKNFSEDVRKYAHVTGMMALNQTEQEKKAGIMRVGWLMLREDDFEISNEVHVLQCLQMGRPCLASY